MYLKDEIIQCSSRKDRIEIFPFYDCHTGKRNCAEDAIKKQIKEILRRDALANRHVRVILGGDQLNAINAADIRRFDFDELADWLVAPSDEELKEGMTSGEVANLVRQRLSNMVGQEVTHTAKLFAPVRHLIIGALMGNHEKSMKTKQSLNVHSALCDQLNIIDLTDEAIIRVRAKWDKTTSTTVIYLRHGYGAGRTPGAEPNKLARMLNEWEGADVCLSGHSHSFCINPPKAVAKIPRKGKFPNAIQYKYRWAANPGCWLYSHLKGASSYESMSCYEAKPMSTLKIVIWPFWHAQKDGDEVRGPKIELRQYAIL